MSEHEPSPFAEFAGPPRKSALAELRQRQRDERVWRWRLLGLSAAAVLGASLTASVDACLRAGEGGVFGAAFLRAALGGAAGLLAGIVLGAVGFSTFALAGRL